MNPIIMIPARLASSRLPQKVLQLIHGKTMIEHVIEAAQRADLGPVCVACCSNDIKAIAEKKGCQAVLTDPDHPSGSDRIFEALQTIDPQKKHDMVINLQGDIPGLEHKILQDLLKPFKDPTVDIATLCYEIQDEWEDEDPNVVKVIAANLQERHGQALYFTRGTPYGDGPTYHHVGLYAYKRAALEQFVSLEPSPLEKRERLEQLRALEHGMRIGIHLVDHGPMGVDTHEDLERVRTIMQSIP